MITRRDFIKGLGAAVGATLMPRAKRVEAAIVSDGMTGYWDANSFNDRYAEDIQVAHIGCPRMVDNLGMVIDLGECVSFDGWVVRRIWQTWWVEMYEGEPIGILLAKYDVRDCDERLFVKGLSSSDLLTDPEAVEGIFKTLDLQAEWEARERLGRNDDERDYEGL